MNGEHTLEDAVMDGLGRCFDIDHLRVPHEPDDPVVVKVDGRYVAVNEHSHQNSDYWDANGGLQKCNDHCNRLTEKQETHHNYYADKREAG